METELRRYGVKTVPWDYYCVYNLPEPAALLSKGPIVIRHHTSFIGGGTDMSIIREPNELNVFSTPSYDTIYAISPYLEPNIPLNINACVFHDGAVSIHPLSLQLIGIPSCVAYPLAYCGNDFAQIRSLDAKILDDLEEMTTQVGKWLAEMGYLGAFGIDAIEHRGQVYLSEINPRFQNSSVIAAKLDEELDRPELKSHGCIPRYDTTPAYSFERASQTTS